MPLLLALALVGVASVIAPSYDPVEILPDSYALQFENEWVKVVRVRYAPNAKLPAHAHTALPSAYVYLNDSGPVLFRHIGASYGAATRPATKARSFRVFRGIEEIHEVENLSDLPSEFLRVEFKTDPKDVRTLKGRFFSEPGPAGQNLDRVQFENEQIRITRLTIAPTHSLDVGTNAGEPALIIALAETTSERRGAERWLEADQTTTLKNPSAEPTEFLRFDFKTRPVTSVER
jgi:hypothetical protein